MDACRAFAELLAEAFAGTSRTNVLAPRPFEGAAAIAQFMAGSWRGRPREKIRSSGYVVHTLEAALWSVARTGDFRNAVLLAANLADDADMVAAVTGQLAGALYGLSGIPDEWLERGRLERSAPAGGAAAAAGDPLLRRRQIGEPVTAVRPQPQLVPDPNRRGGRDEPVHGGVHEHSLQLQGLRIDRRHVGRLQRRLPRKGDRVAVPVGGDRRHR